MTNVRNKAQEIKDARKLLFDLVKSVDLQQEVFASIPEIYSLEKKREVQMVHLKDWCELLNIKYKRADWGGNKVCNKSNKSHCLDINWDIIWFEFDNVKFFELVDKENEHEGQ